MKICIASPDIVGPIRNGGVGTACTALAQTLAAEGHEVTLFYTSSFFEVGDLRHWQDAYDRLGVRLIGLEPGTVPPLHRSPTVYDTDNLARSYQVYEALKGTDFDLIHFVDYVGLGYFTALARSQGLCLPNTRVAVTAHSPTLWSRLANAAMVDDISYLVRDRMERRLIELADLLISPSHYMLRWLRDEGFKLPSRQVMLPNLMPVRLQGAAAEPRRAEGRVRELVFFGRLEPRKGLLVFCDAIDRISDALPPDVGITFLGKIGRDYPQDAIAARTARWNRPVQLLSELDTFQAVDYLQGGGRLAVLAALHDNSPYTVLECLHHRIPFVSSDVGGVAELVAPESRDAVLFPPTPAGLGDHLLRTLAAGQFGPARSNVDAAANRAAWLRLHRGLEGEVAAARLRGVPVPRSRPLVSVNILHFERPAGLAQALEGLRQQGYREFETIIVDNGSRSPEAVAYLDELERTGGPGLHVLRMGENVYEPAARNAGAYAARGKYVLFMDDDNVPKPNELETFVTAAETGGADVLTCFTDHFVTDAPPASAAEALKRFVVMGDFGPLGLILNGYGDLNCFVRRDRFLSIGGFVVDGRFNHAEDWRFFAKAWARGLRVDVVPEALLWYRTTLSSWGTGWRKRDRNGAMMRAAETYLEQAPEEVKPFLLLAQGLFWKAVSTEAARRDQAKEAEGLRREVARLAAAKEAAEARAEGLRDAFAGMSHFVLESVAPVAEIRPELQRGVELARRMARKHA